MTRHSVWLPIRLCLLAVFAIGLFTPPAPAQDAATTEAIAGFEKALQEVKGGESEARQRLAVRRVIRDAEELLAKHPADRDRFFILELLFRARQHLLTLDKDVKFRQEFLETCRELAKAPDDLAGMRLEADMLVTQAELAKQGADASARARALRPMVDRYLDTPAGAKALRLAMIMALELGDSRTISNLQELITEYFPADLEMIAFQRDKLGGQVIGAPFCGTFERSDGKKVRFPMDGLGRSTLLIFWSKDENGMTLLKDVAAAALAGKDGLQGRLDFVSFNLDELPDAGESIVRGLGVDWPVLRLPGGKKNPIYDAFARNDPRMVTMSPTGQCALIMSGTSKVKTESDGTPDYGRMFGSNLSRSWNQPRYVAQLVSLMAGEFLVVDPEMPFDPSRPPELKALAKGAGGEALSRDAGCVPEEKLRAIQECFVLPPQRYRLSPAEAREHYAKAVELSRQAIAAHPQAPDLWIVRNRLIIALMGLWKSDADLKHLEAAIVEAKAALSAGGPKGSDVIARFCIARETLRDAAVNPRECLDRLIADCGGESAPGPALAAAAMLAVDVADRPCYDRYRSRILKDHTEYPMMWTFAAFLLDRHHDYWLFQIPFTAGWSYGKREGFFMSKGDPEPAQRMLKAELLTADGKPFRIPEDLDSEWTLISFSMPPPWFSKRDDVLPASPSRAVHGLNEFAATRPQKDVKVILAILGGDAEAARVALSSAKTPFTTPILIVPGGVGNPLVRRLGILSEDQDANSVLIHKDGRIALMLSGIFGKDGSRTLGNVVMRDDEINVLHLLERGEVQAAKEKILALAPPFDPEAVDERGRKLRPPSYSLSHLRARARVYMALKEWAKALADAEEVVSRQLGTDGGMSLRTDELDASEALRDQIRERMKSEGGK